MADDTDLIAAIYDAIIDPSGWDDVVKRIVTATKSVSGGISICADAAHLTSLCNVDPFYTNAYVHTYYKRNPYSPEEAKIAPGEVRTGTHIIQTDSFRASVFYNEYMRPQGWADAVAIGLLRTPNAVGYLSLQRSPDAIWVEPAEWNLLETLAPHLKRAAEVHRLLSEARAATESLGAAVGAAGFSVFLLTKECRVLFANAAGQDLLRRGIVLASEHGRLVAATPALTTRLHALARESSRPDRAEGGIGGTLELPRGENHPPLLAHVIPLAPIRVVSRTAPFKRRILIARRKSTNAPKSSTNFSKSKGAARRTLHEVRGRLREGSS
jgi:hypothetical protein